MNSWALPVGIGALLAGGSAASFVAWRGSRWLAFATC